MSTPQTTSAPAPDSPAQPAHLDAFEGFRFLFVGGAILTLFAAGDLLSRRLGLGLERELQDALQAGVLVLLGALVVFGGHLLGRGFSWALLVAALAGATALWIVLLVAPGLAEAGASRDRLLVLGLLAVSLSAMVLGAFGALVLRALR